MVTFYLKKHLDIMYGEIQVNISKSKDEPIVLIPFTCNDDGDSKSNYFDHNNKKKLNTIYQEFIKNKY